MPRLQELEVIEVSLVDLPANKRKFLLTKSDGGRIVDELLALILETDMENEGELDQALAEAGFDEQTQLAVKGALKLLNAHRENLSPDVVKGLLTKAGFIEDAASGGAPEPAEALLKEDGTLNLEGVPDNLHAALQALWEKQQTSDEIRDELEKTLKAERDEKRTKDFLHKAKALPVPMEVDVVAELMMRTEERLPDLYPHLVELLTKTSALLEDSPTLKELGDGRESEGTSAYDRAVAKAKKLMETDASLTLPVAIDTVFKADRELAEQHNQETR